VARCSCSHASPRDRDRPKPARRPRIFPSAKGHSGLCDSVIVVTKEHPTSPVAGPHVPLLCAGVMLTQYIFFAYGAECQNQYSIHVAIPHEYVNMVFTCLGL